MKNTLYRTLIAVAPLFLASNILANDGKAAVEISELKQSETNTEIYSRDIKVHINNLETKTIWKKDGDGAMPNFQTETTVYYKGGGYQPKCSDAAGCSGDRPFLINDVNLDVGTVKELEFTAFEEGVVDQLDRNNSNAFYPLKFDRDSEFVNDGEFIEYFQNLTETFFSPWAGEDATGKAVSLWDNIYSKRDNTSQNYIMNIIYGVQDSQRYPSEQENYSLLDYPTTYKKSCNWMADSTINSLMCNVIQTWRIDPLTKMNPFNNIDTDIEMDTLIGLLTLAGEYRQRDKVETFIDKIWNAAHGATDNYRDMQLKGGEYDLSGKEVIISAAVNEKSTGADGKGLGKIKRVAFLKIRKIKTPDRDKTQYKLCDFRDANAGSRTDLSQNCFSYNPGLVDALMRHGFNMSPPGMSMLDFKKFNNERFICVEEPMLVIPKEDYFRRTVMSTSSAIDESTCEQDSEGNTIYYPTYIPRTFAHWFANMRGDVYDEESCFDQARQEEEHERYGFSMRHWATKGCYKNDLPDRKLIIEVEVVRVEDTLVLDSVQNVGPTYDLTGRFDNQGKGK